MNKQQMNEAMQISRNFANANEKAKLASRLLSQVRSLGNHFISPEAVKVLREADLILDEIIDKSNDWEAAKYAANTLIENPSLPNI